MRLKDWMDDTQTAPEAVAEAIGYSVSGLTKLIRGERFPRPDIQQKIRDFTAGAVTPNDWVEAWAERPTPAGAAA